MSCKYCGGRGYLEHRFPLTGMVSTEPCSCKDGEKGTLLITAIVIIVLTVALCIIGGLDAAS